MARKISAGTLLWRRDKYGGLEVLIVHPSGRRHRGAPWSIPKGEVEGKGDFEAGDILEATARRETLEETGVVAGQLLAVGLVDYVKGGKRVYGFAGETPAAAAPRCASWEVDRAQFVEVNAARRLLHEDLRPLLDRLVMLVGASACDSGAVRSTPEDKSTLRKPTASPVSPFQSNREFEAAVRQAIRDMIAHANHSHTKLPLSNHPQTKICPEHLNISLSDINVATLRRSRLPVRIARITSRQEEVFNRQIQHSGGLYLSYYVGDIFINQLANMYSASATRWNAQIAKELLWLRWNPNERRYVLTQSGASEALLNRIFATEKRKFIYRAGYVEELGLFRALRDPFKADIAIAELRSYLDAHISRKTFYGHGRVRGYFFTSDYRRARYHAEKKRTRLYRASVTLDRLTQLARESKLYADLEWVDEINFFSIESLWYLSDLYEVVPPT